MGWKIVVEEGLGRGERECVSNSKLKKMCCAPLNNIIPTTILTTRETDLNEGWNNKRAEEREREIETTHTEREREREKEGCGAP